MQTPLQTPLKSHFYAVSERTTDRIFAPLKKILWPANLEFYGRQNETL